MADPVLAWAIFGTAWVVLLAVNIRRSQRKQRGEPVPPAD